MLGCVVLFACLSAILPGSKSLAIVDEDFSPYVGSEDLLTLHKTAESFEDRSYPSCYRSEANLSQGMLRFSTLLFGWLPFDDWIVTTNHEVFGHGYRIRSLPKSKARVIGYHIGRPLPYGLGGGSTSYEYSDQLSVSESVAISIAGLEASQVLSERLRMSWIQSNLIPASLSPLYLSAALDLNSYIHHTRAEQQFHANTDGNDILCYIGLLDQIYPMDPMSFSTLEKQSRWNYFDPFLYYALFDLFLYIATGKYMPVPMIPLGKVSYLPATHLSLTPFGNELYLDQYFRYQSTPFYFYLRYGHQEPNRFFGAGLEVPRAVDLPACTLGVRLSAWRQPHYRSNRLIPFENGDSQLDPSDNASRIGFAGSLIAVTRMKKEIPLSFYTELGYKTPGYLPGYSLGAQPIVRLGFSYEFPLMYGSKEGETLSIGDCKV